MPFVAPPPNAEYTDIVEAAFGYTRDVDPATWVFTDITKYVRGAITISKGRPDATSTADPTRISLTLDNSDGRFTKGNPLSPYWPNVVRGVPLRVRRTWKNAGALYERATAFVAGWPVVPVSGVRYVETPIDAWGRLRQLRRDNALAGSPLFKTITASSPVAYWSLEDAAGSTSAASGIAGGTPMRVSNGTVTFGADDRPAGAASAVALSGPGTLNGKVTGGSSTAWRVEFSTKFDTLAVNAFVMPIMWVTGGSVAIWVIDATGGVGGTTLSIQYYLNPGDTAVTDAAFDFTPVDDGLWHRIRIDGVQSGSDIAITVKLDGTTIISHTFASLTMGAISQVKVNPTIRGTGSVSVMSHVAVWAPFAGSSDTFAAATGYPAESATTRIARLGVENSIPVTTAAGIGTPQPLGVQTVETLGNLLDGSANADCGLLHDGGTLGGLYYASPGARYNVAPQLSVAYAASQISDGFSGTDDDQQLTNDVTIARVNGSSGEWVNTASATAEGKITGQDTLNLATDNQPDKVAQLRSNLSSYDAMRFPLAPLDLRRNPELVQAWTALTLPAYIAITGVPLPFPPASIDQFIEGYTETLDAVTWTVTANCSPAAPWRVMVLDDTTNPFRLDADSLVVNAGVSASATSFGLKTNGTAPLVTTAGGDFPFLILDVTTGEVMRLTNVTGGASPQTATVVRAVNGVSKALGTNDPIVLYRPATLAL